MALPALSACATETTIDLSLTLGRERPQGGEATWLLTRTFDGQDKPWMSVARRDDGYLIRVHGSADFHVDLSGSQIDCVPVLGCPEADLEQLFLDQIIPQVLHLRGQPSFHASAIVTADGRVVGFLGNSGAGKSTMAAALGGGHGSVCDDSLSLRIEGDQISVFPGYPSVRLASDSATALCSDRDELNVVAPRTNKLRVPMKSEASARLLSQLYVLDAGDHPSPEKIPLSKRDALLELAKYVHRLDPNDRERLREEMNLLEAVVLRVPVALLRYRHDYDDIAKVRALVLP
ncbi:hypothetical protein JYT22_00070 [Endomicrobium sp. AH-315-J14]|nr:hypothetical protein [Endomicrobium sp. AH-315-J14]